MGKYLTLKSSPHSPVATNHFDQIRVTCRMADWADDMEVASMYTEVGLSSYEFFYCAHKHCHKSILRA